MSNSCLFEEDQRIGNSTLHKTGLYIGTAGVVIMTAVSVVIILLNTIILVTILCYKKLHSVSYYFYASFTVADFLVGLVMLPVAMALNNSPEKFHQYWLCISVSCLPAFAIVTFMLHMVITSFDLHYKIMYPFKYPRKMTKKRCFITIFSVWFCASVVSFSPVLGWNTYWERCLLPGFHCSPKNVLSVTYFCIITYVIIVPCIITIVVFNVRVIRLAKITVQQIKISRPKMADSVTNKYNASRKSTITLLFILFFLSIFWLPFLVILQITLICSDCAQNSYVVIGMLAALGSAAMGPITAVLRHREYRHIVRKLAVAACNANCWRGWSSHRAAAVNQNKHPSTTTQPDTVSSYSPGEKLEMSNEVAL
ncbi:adenosine receptor A1-like [Saccoglossus kowalevskii]|uniref:Adenosine receptor A1-like n=1 Tax=Saccoglossus kowalevskii TaxID=10224 RepID=A0ABM0MHZ8_SACKO|nr:PREDICTED: adenosine receptor A1-like [Saccoglossus kowalevskii]